MVSRELTLPTWHGDAPSNESLDKAVGNRQVENEHDVYGFKRKLVLEQFKGYSQSEGKETEITHVSWVPTHAQPPPSTSVPRERQNLTNCTASVIR